MSGPTQMMREHWFADYQRRAVEANKQLHAGGYARAGAALTATLRSWGYAGRERWTTWEEESPTPLAEVWFPLWMVQVCLWLAPSGDEFLSKYAQEHLDRMVRRLLHTLSHDAEGRAAALSIARLGRAQVVEFLRHYDASHRVCDGVGTSPDSRAFRCGDCRRRGMEPTVTPGAHPSTHTPADNCELIASALHPDDAELLAAGAVEVDLETVADDHPDNDLD